MDLLAGRGTVNAQCSSRRGRRRLGAATVDYVLVLGVIFPLAAFIMWIGPRIIRLAYEMVCVLVSWPLM